ncbi:MAG: hypothetical protein AB8H79_23415, partial [Myxococcota bacterium]
MQTGHSVVVGFDVSHGGVECGVARTLSVDSVLRGFQVAVSIAGFDGIVGELGGHGEGGDLVVVRAVPIEVQQRLGVELR